MNEILAKWTREGVMYVGDGYDGCGIKKYVQCFAIRMDEVRERFGKMLQTAKGLTAEKYNANVKCKGDTLQFKLGNDALFCCADGDCINVEVQGNKQQEQLKRFFADFWTLCFPNQQLTFETLSEAEKLKRREAEDQKRRGELEKERQRIRERRLFNSLTELDHKIIELRKQGASFWSISRQLGVSKAKVEYTLKKAALIPELTKDWKIEFQPLTREERKQKE